MHRQRTGGLPPYRRSLRPHPRVGVTAWTRPVHDEPGFPFCFARIGRSSSAWRLPAMTLQGSRRGR